MVLSGEQASECCFAHGVLSFVQTFGLKRNLNFHFPALGPPDCTPSLTIFMANSFVLRDGAQQTRTSGQLDRRPQPPSQPLYCVSCTSPIPSTVSCTPQSPVNINAFLSSLIDPLPRPRPRPCSVCPLPHFVQVPPLRHPEIPDWLGTGQRSDSRGGREHIARDDESDLHRHEHSDADPGL